jgi:hypothetical protein
MRAIICQIKSFNFEVSMSTFKNLNFIALILCTILPAQSALAGPCESLNARLAKYEKLQKEFQEDADKLNSSSMEQGVAQGAVWIVSALGLTGTLVGVSSPGGTGLALTSLGITVVIDGAAGLVLYKLDGVPEHYQSQINALKKVFGEDLNSIDNKVDMLNAQLLKMDCR